jgi:hypothetical protein
MTTIKFLKSIELEIIESIDNEDNIESSPEMFYQDEIFEVDVIDQNEDTISIQFGDGSCVYSIPKIILEII